MYSFLEYLWQQHRPFHPNGAVMVKSYRTLIFVIVIIGVLLLIGFCRETTDNTATPEQVAHAAYIGEQLGTIQNGDLIVLQDDSVWLVARIEASPYVPPRICFYPAICEEYTFLFASQSEEQAARRLSQFKKVVRPGDPEFLSYYCRFQARDNC